MQKNRRQQMGDLDVPLKGRYEPPLENGEVVFEAPWQGRVFGLAVRLAEEQVFQWAEFQASLIEVVGEWDEANIDAPDGGDYPYFELFAEALSRLLVTGGHLTSLEIETRDAALAARPHGHDH